MILNSAHADLQQMQLRRIYQASNITFHVFSDEKSARNWLAEFLQQKSNNHKLEIDNEQRQFNCRRKVIKTKELLRLDWREKNEK